MASTMILLFIFLFIFSTSFAQISFHPKALFLPITKDSSTKQYITQLGQRTPLVQVSLTLDLGGESLWVDCDPPYTSSTYRPARCGSAECSLAHARGCGDACFSSARPGCNNHTCSDFSLNSVGDGVATSSVPGSDVVYIRTTDGRVVSVPHFIFVCPLTYLLDGLATGVTGMAGLGRTSIALPSQFSSSFSLPRKFFMCLPSSPKSKGVVVFGNAPPNFLPKDLIYTPLIKNPISTAFLYFKGEPSAEYFITLKSIKVAGKMLRLNTTLLAIDKHGNGGTKISTVTPYTILETSIYNSLLKTFILELSNVSRVASIAPFGACYNSTTLGANVPEIDLVLQSESVVWRIFGENSMVLVRDDVLCLGFVDGGVNPRTSVVIGGHQIEDILLQFDLASSRLGFSSSLLGKGTSCGNFNFTSNA